MSQILPGTKCACSSTLTHATSSYQSLGRLSFLTSGCPYGRPSMPCMSRWGQAPAALPVTVPHESAGLRRQLCSPAEPVVLPLPLENTSMHAPATSGQWPLQAVASAPLWDEEPGMVIGMISASDFIHVLRRLRHRQARPWKFGLMAFCEKICIVS